MLLYISYVLKVNLKNRTKFFYFYFILSKLKLKMNIGKKIEKFPLKSFSENMTSVYNWICLQ